MKFLFLLLSFLFSQGLNINENIYSRVYKELESITNKEIFDNLFIYPTREIEQKTYKNLFKKSKNLYLYPSLAIRFSQAGFEINNDIPNSILWISPGLEFKFNQILLNIIDPVWIHGEFNFYKHSAYGINHDLNMGSTIGNQENQNSDPIFLYNDNYQYGFYRDVKSDSNNGIDFDESIGYTSILGNRFDLTIGKFRSSLGPSVYSNLALSNTMPAFNQIRFNYNYNNKVYFTFIIGDLYSNLIDSSFIYEDEVFDDKYSIMNRRLYNHRIDFKINKKLRVGFYEQIISSANNSGSLSYINPFQFYWSEQHQSNDLDNLQMGFDFDYLYSKYRFYGSILIDEWALYKTFNEDSQNWFAKQIGLSKIFKLQKFNNNIDGIIKFEYSSAEPQVYTHKFEINIPTHHNYSIGLWSGGDSIDKRLSIIFFVNNIDKKNSLIIDLSYQNTRFGNPVYDKSISLLSQDNIKIRDLLSIQLKKKLFYNIDCYFKVGYYKTENLYSEDNFLDISTSLLYNIKN